MSTRRARSIRSFLVVAAAVATLTALVGCSGASQSQRDGATTGEMAPNPAKGVTDGGGGFTADSKAPDRSVISTGDLTMTVTNPAEAAAKVAEIAVGAGGRVDARQEVPGSATEPGRADLVLRVPTSKFEATVQSLKQVGTVLTLSTQQTDVTQQRIDLDARVKALTTAVERLNALLAKATTTADLIVIESEMSKRQAELDSLTQQRDALVGQVDLATLSVHLFSPKLAPTQGPNDFWSGLVAGWNALVTFVGGLVITVGVALPWLVALALLAAVVWWIIRASARRSRARRSWAAPAAPAPNGAPSEAATPTASAAASDAPAPPAD